MASSGAGSSALEFTGARDGNLLTLTFGAPIALGSNQLVNLTISGEVGAGATAPFTTGLELKRVLRSDAGDSRVSRLAPAAISVGVWDSVRIDGSFADWENVAKTADATGDMTTALGGGLVANMNVDLVASALLDTGDFYAEVSGTMLGGMDFPSYTIRRGAAPPPDWNTSDDDRDGVPNRDDPMPDDFDNDGANDSAEGGDSDGDGALEWPHGPDYWLNTTIPAGFPSGYAGATRSVYVGPVSEREMRGEDSIILWIDRDGDSATGAPVAGGLGADYAAIVNGRGGAPTATTIASYDPSQGAIPWLDLGEALAVASDFGRLEGRLPAWAMGTDIIVSVELRDSEGGSDAGDTPLELDAMAAGTRSPAGDNVVVNEVVARPSNAEWVELCNPTGAAIAIGGWRLINAFGGVIATIPAGTFIGAFGSGSEYYVADLSSIINNIPDLGTQVALQRPRNLGRWTTIDILYYGATADYQSTARFKNATFGMPTDTDATTGDTYVSSLASWAAPNDRRRPAIAVDKAGDRTTAQPGMTVVYTIHYNNTGDADARHVWVNDTLPAGMTYVSSSQPYASVSGQTYGWYFSGVAPGTHSFTITARVDASTPVGATLTNTASLSYTDQLSRPMGLSSDSWLVTVSAPAPFIAVMKVSSTPTASPGETISYTIWYNNTGAGVASHVWVNDTLPTGMAYASAAPAPSSIVGQTQYWHFASVAPGTYFISLQATVGVWVAPGTVLTNTATCNYKDLGGSSLPSSSSQAAVTVAAASARLVINEVSSLPNPEWVEICNPTGVAVNIGGWRIYSSFANPIYTFPAGTIIGAWGSGTEYLAAQMTQSNRLPNGGGPVTLRNSALAVVDSTTYPAMVSGQTWSRFKHEDTGMPVDTNSNLDFYVSNNAWIVPEGPTPSAANDRHMPIMEVEKSANVAEAEPGDIISYTIWYNNTGDGNAKRVWVNDTLPAGTTYVSATPTPTSISGQLVSWYFPTVTKETTNSITVSVLISGEPADGTVLSNVADLSYRDQLLRPMASSLAWANVTSRKPTIIVEKVADVAVVQPGGTITYTIFYNNTGSRSAAHVWINDTLPQYVNFQSSSVAPTTVSGLTYGWHFTNVAPGAHSLTITVQVNATAPSGIITNLAVLNYTASNSKPLAGNSDAASVLVVVPELGPEYFAVVLVVLLGLAYRSRRRREAI